MVLLGTPGVILAILVRQVKEVLALFEVLVAEGVGHGEAGHQPLVQMKAVRVADGTKHLARAQPEAG